ncbi:MAG: glycosyltransferase family 2 protein [Mucinivorans sp.]
MNIDVSVIIVNYNTNELLAEALDSLFEHTTGLSLQVIVVDNHSLISPREALAASYSSSIEWVDLPQNVGFARANNAAFDLALGRHLFLLNPDTILMNNAVKILSDYLDSNPQVGAVGGNLFTREGLPTASHKFFGENLYFELDSLFFEPVGRLIYGRNRIFNHTVHPLRVGYIIGADLMIPRSVIDSVGGFDPDFFMYAEESELQYRIKAHGFSIVNCPAANIIHLEGGSFDFSEHRERMMLAGKVLYYTKCFGRPSAKAMIALRKAMMISRIAVLWLLGSSRKLSRHKMLYRILREYSFTDVA